LRLGQLERASFLLHDVFGLEFEWREPFEDEHQGD
jgi:hypothetical protein